MIRRELAELKYALIIFLSCLLVYFVRKDAKVWREILMRNSQIFEETRNLEVLKEELKELKDLSKIKTPQEAPKSFESPSEAARPHQEKPYRNDSKIKKEKKCFNFKFILPKS